MFRLEQEINAWCQSVIPDACGREAQLAELKDHVYCRIDQYLDQGMSEEQAFATAIEQLGNAEDLSAEFGKTKSALSALCSNTPDSASAGLSPKKLALFTFVYLILFAIVTFSAMSLLAGTGYFEGVSVLLYTLWVTPLLLYPSLYRSSRSEWACIKRLFSSLRRS